MTWEHLALDVPGARLHVQRVGSGPAVVLVPGGDGDADALDGLARQLAPRFTVLTHDRRGLSRSVLHGPATATLDAHVDDLRAVLERFAPEGAAVFANSLGAVVALGALTQGAPMRVLVAHEPPVTELLSHPWREKAQADQLEVEAQFAKGGLGAAMRAFVAITGVTLIDREPEVRLPVQTPERLKNLHHFLTHHIAAARTYRVNQPALKTLRDRVVPAVGRTNETLWVHQCGLALAAFLQKDVLRFPGGHTGPITHPRAYAEVLARVFGG